MTVAELVQELEKASPEMEVFIVDGGYGHSVTLTKVREVRHQCPRNYSCRFDGQTVLILGSHEDDIIGDVI